MGPTNSGSWGAPRAQTSMPLQGQAPWSLRPMGQVQTEPGMLTNAPTAQQPDVADFMKRYYGWGGTQGFTKMQ